MKPQIKHTEIGRTFTTKDYSLFEFPDFRISKKYFDEIKASIKNKNLSYDFPILVAPESYKIIDGRYRFLACYDMQLPIHYRVSKDTKVKDAVRIKHLHKNYDIQDIIKVYSDLDPYNNIILLYEEMDGYFNYTFITLCIPQAKSNRASTINRGLFDSGSLGEWDYNEVKSRLLRVKSFFTKYHEFGWTKMDALIFVYSSPFNPTTKEEWNLKNTSRFQTIYNEISNGVFIDKSSSYKVLSKCMEDIRSKKDIPPMASECLKRMKVNF